MSHVENCLKDIALIEKNLMKDKVFVDTNILIYYVSNNVEKKILAKELIINNEGIVISSQVINEFVSVVLKKHILPYAQVVNYSK